jgi:hypothetical protein
VSAMRRLTLGLPGPRNLLVVGAHADDVEIGAGATILRLLAEGPGSSILWVVASATPEREAEARSSSGLPDGPLPTASSAMKDLLESVKTLTFGLIVSPQLDEAHQDLSVATETVWQRFRHHLVAGCEIRKCDGDLGRPNLYVDINDEKLQRKGDLLEAHYTSQRGRTGCYVNTIRAVAHLRAIEAATCCAEAFYCRKFVL